MRFNDILKLEREECIKVLENIHNKMDELGIDELVSRIKNLIKACVPDSVWGKKELLEKNDYTVEFKNKKIFSIKMFYEYYDELCVELDFVGMKVVFIPEHRDKNIVFEIDGFDEFVSMSDNL